MKSSLYQLFGRQRYGPEPGLIHKNEWMIRLPLSLLFAQAKWATSALHMGHPCLVNASRKHGENDIPKGFRRTFLFAQAKCAKGLRKAVKCAWNAVIMWKSRQQLWYKYWWHVRLHGIK
jgi:hypothetical protein